MRTILNSADKCSNAHINGTLTESISQVVLLMIFRSRPVQFAPSGESPCNADSLSREFRNRLESNGNTANLPQERRRSHKDIGFRESIFQSHQNPDSLARCRGSTSRSRLCCPLQLLTTSSSVTAPPFDPLSQRWSQHPSSYLCKRVPCCLSGTICISLDILRKTFLFGTSAILKPSDR